MKLLIAGFDGLDSRLFEDTELPELKKIRETSQWGTLRSEKMETGASWTTILTGWLAETHKLVGFVGPTKENPIWFGSRPHDYIFDELGRAGFTVGVINFPTMRTARPIEGVGGWMVAGWPYHPNAYPGTLEIQPDYFTSLADYAHRYAPQREPSCLHHHTWWPYLVVGPDEYYKLTRENQQRRIEIAQNAPPVDVLMIQCSMMDRIGHILSIHPDYERGTKHKDEYERVLELVDWSVGELLRRFEPEHFALVSDHGFHDRGHSPTGTWALSGPDVFPLRLDTEQENFMPTVMEAMDIKVMREGTSVLIRRSEQARQSEVLAALGYM